MPFRATKACLDWPSKGEVLNSRHVKTWEHLQKNKTKVTTCALLDSGTRFCSRIIVEQLRLRGKMKTTVTTTLLDKDQQELTYIKLMVMQRRHLPWSWQKLLSWISCLKVLWRPRQDSWVDVLETAGTHSQTGEASINRLLIKQESP